MPEDYFEEKFYLIYYPELLFTSYNMEDKAYSHYNKYGKKKNFIINRKQAYEQFL